MLDDISNRIQCLVVVSCLFISGCADLLQWSPESYVVESGDTLYSIAFSYRIDQRDLAAWNKLGSGTMIYPGQKLKLRGSAGAGSKGGAGSSSASRSSSKSGSTVSAATAKPVAAWEWPTDGKVVSNYRASSKTQSGIQIGGKRGQPVRAAAGGEVVYSGSGLPGYGQLLIIKHNTDYLSAYGHNDSLTVSEGDTVKIGQPIALMGNGPGRRPVLHFEIRIDGQPVDPTRYLPAQ